MFKFILKTFIGLMIVFLLIGKIYAAQNLSIRIEQPKTPTNQNTFDLVFVTLDVKGRTITVKCFEKGPTDSIFSQFGPDIVIPSGGDTKSCHVNSSIVNSNGIYQFYATATADSDVATSQTNSIDFNNSDGPGMPSEFNKTKISSCEYKISYKTADDAGKTVKIELYRSDNQQFGADPQTRVGVHAVGSNAVGSFTDSIPDCDKTYYYVVRAFDVYGNGSELAGDASATITTESTSTITSTTTAPSESQIGAIPVSQNNANVLGEESTPSSETQEVKGEAQEPGSEKAKEGLFTSRNALIALAIAILTGAGFWYYKLRKAK